MHQRIDRAGVASSPVSGGTVRIASRSEISGSAHWQTAFAQERKDHRYYELVEDTIKESFKYGYFIIEGGRNVIAIQPYFLVDQDLLAGINGHIKKLIAGVRRFWPRFMRARTLMVATAGEGHLDGDERSQLVIAEVARAIAAAMARELNCVMVVLKEFPPSIARHCCAYSRPASPACQACR